MVGDGARNVNSWFSRRFGDHRVVDGLLLACLGSLDLMFLSPCLHISYL